MNSYSSWLWAVVTYFEINGLHHIFTYVYTMILWLVISTENLSSKKVSGIKNINRKIKVKNNKGNAEYSRA